MTTFTEASQARLIIKMKLSNYGWYKSCSVVTNDNGYAVLVGVNRLNDSIRKIIPYTCHGVVVKTQVEQ